MDNEKRKIILKENEAAKLRHLNDRMQACNDFLDQMQMRCQEQLIALQSDTREFWTKIASEYDLDLKHVNYELDRDGKTIVAVAERFDVR